MKSAPVPHDEAARLAALREYDILDSLPEQAFDDIAFIASVICETPVALVSLVDCERQWFKSRLGLDATETPRALALCAHAILEPNSLFVVRDAAADSRFADNPLVTDGPRIRFYAGAPLVTAEGHALGTLCVIDSVPHELTREQGETLSALSRQVVAQLELRKTVAQLQQRSAALHQSHAVLEQRTTQLERSRDELGDLCHVLERQADMIERDLRRAEVIQRALLPQDVPCLENFCVKTLYRPGKNIGGDLYEVVTIGDRHLALVIADAAGHGVSAAMLSVLFKNRLKVVDADGGEPLAPAAALARLNEALRADVSAPGVFVTAAFCLLDVETRELRVASAGHPPLLWLREGGELERIPHTGPALGLYSGASFGEHQVTLGPGDRLLLYTDGIFDVGGDEPPTEESIVAAVQAAGEGPKALGKALVTVSNGMEREDRDDVTMVLLQATSGKSHFYEPLEDLPIAPMPGADGPRVCWGETVSATFVSLAGRVTWTFADTLLETVEAVVDAGRGLILDLGACIHLDSTMLGTLHEIVAYARAFGRSVRIQRVPADIARAFEELSMVLVLESITRKSVAAPSDLCRLELPEIDVKRHQERLLKAHEVLAELSDANRVEFDTVVKMLRADMER